MNKSLLYPLGSSASCRRAAEILRQAGFLLTDHPSPEITHILLDVPSFQANGYLKNGSDFQALLRMMPKDVTIIGGNLDPAYLEAYRKTDLLKDPGYLAKNAAITAECAMRFASPYLKSTFSDSPALILGWGRIGKCLARILSSLGCPVTVAARKASDRAMLEALGYLAVDFPQIPQAFSGCAIVFNTVPDLTMPEGFPPTTKNTVLIDLASEPGLAGTEVIPARGLPGKYAPETSGKLIAETILRLCKEEAL